MTVEAVRDVILVHGLWTPAAVLWPLAWRLARRGYAPRLFSYPGRGAFTDNVASFARSARTSGRAAHVVGHSLGGVLALAALNANLDIALGALVLIAAPARGSTSARRLAAHPFGRWMLGESALPLCGGESARWERRELLGVIAGTRPLGAGRLLGRLPAANDGVVMRSETEVNGASDKVCLDHGHTGLLMSRELAARVDEFLREGRFAHAAPPCV